MSNFLRNIALIFFLFFAICESQGQDISFSQYYSNAMHLNPALTGNSYVPRLSFQYRNQWTGLESTFANYSASFDTYIEALRGGLGLQILDEDQASGTINALSANLNYSFYSTFSRKYVLKMGFQVSYFQSSLNWDKLIFSDMIDPLTGKIVSGKEVKITSSDRAIDFSTGITFGTKNFHLGVAANHITKAQLVNNDSLTDLLPLKLTFHAGTDLTLAKETKKKNATTLAIRLMFQQQKIFQQINYHLSLTKKPFRCGIALRQHFSPQINTDAMIVLLGIVSNTFEMNYSYDITLSKLTQATSGSHEISLIIYFLNYNSQKKNTPHAIECPK